MEEVITPEIIGIRLNKGQIKAYGCSTCIWKASDFCPHGLHNDECATELICKEYYDFIVSFAGNTNSTSIMLEKFALFMADSQQRLDYMEMKSLEKRLKELEEEGKVHTEEYDRLTMKYNVLKMLWGKFNDNSIKGYGRVNDREQKQEMNITIDHKISLSQIHQLANNARKQLGEKK
jgi:hypothetical protein